jgi:TPR repeat protein
MALDNQQYDDAWRSGRNGEIYVPSLEALRDPAASNAHYSAYLAGQAGVPYLAPPNPPAQATVENPIANFIVFLILVALFAVIWAGLTLKPRVEDFFNRHFTDPESATLIGEESLKQKNYTDALYWFEIAAAHGNLEGEFDLGLLLKEQGLDAATKANGLAWIEKAAAGGYSPAKQWLIKPGPSAQKPRSSSHRGPAKPAS